MQQGCPDWAQTTHYIMRGCSQKEVYVTVRMSHLGPPLRPDGICSISKPNISFNLGMKNESRKKMYEIGQKRDTVKGIKTDQ